MIEDTFPAQVDDIWRVTSPTGRWVEFKVINVLPNDYCQCTCTNSGTFDSWPVGSIDQWQIAAREDDDGIWTLIDRDLSKE